MGRDAIEHLAGAGINTVGHLGGFGQGDGAGERFEIGFFDFEGDGFACVFFGFGAVRHLFGQTPEIAIEQVEVGDVFKESCFLGDAFDRDRAP